MKEKLFLIPFIAVMVFCCTYNLEDIEDTPISGSASFRSWGCSDGDTVQAYVFVENWVNADSGNYQSNLNLPHYGVPLQIITCDNLNTANVCDGATYVDNKFFWSGEAKKMKVVAGGGIEWGAAWFPPSPVKDTVGYSCQIYVCKDQLCDTVLWSNDFWPLYHNNPADEHPSEWTGYNNSAKLIPCNELCDNCN